MFAIIEPINYQARLSATRYNSNLKLGISVIFASTYGQCDISFITTKIKRKRGRYSD
jgi:hypothetical protein